MAHLELAHLFSLTGGAAPAPIAARVATETVKGATASSPSFNYLLWTSVLGHPATEALGVTDPDQPESPVLEVGSERLGPSEITNGSAPPVQLSVIDSAHPGDFEADPEALLTALMPEEGSAIDESIKEEPEGLTVEQRVKSRDNRDEEALPWAGYSLFMESRAALRTPLSLTPPPLTRVEGTERRPPLTPATVSAIPAMVGTSAMLVTVSAIPATPAMPATPATPAVPITPVTPPPPVAPVMPITPAVVVAMSATPAMTAMPTRLTTPVLSGPPTPRRPQIAEPFVGTEMESLTEDERMPAVTASGNQVRTQPTAATRMMGSPASGDAQQPLSPVSRDGSSLTASGPANQLPVDTVVAPAVPQQEQILTNTATVQSAESTLPITGNAPMQANTSSTAPVRPEAPTAPAFSSTLPETLETLDLRQNNWGRVLGHQLNWLVNHRMQEAEIRINPPELGPLAIRMSLHQNQANVTFFCHEAVVREAIENALPRLREMLDSQGISLNQAQVFDQTSARQQAHSGEQSPQNPRDGRPSTSAQPDQERPKTREQSRPGLPGSVDDYA